VSVLADAQRDARDWAGQCKAARRNGRHSWQRSDERHARCSSCAAAAIFSGTGQLIEYHDSAVSQMERT
jgi:hypothetical protein